MNRSGQRRRFVTAVLLILMLSSIISVNGFAKTEKIEVNKTYKVDLNGDGRKEKLRVHFSNKKQEWDHIYVNNRKCFTNQYYHGSSGKDGIRFFLCDIDRNDPYKDLVFVQASSILAVYRYENNRIELYGQITDRHNVIELTSWIGYDFDKFKLETPGDGTIKICQSMYAKTSSKEGQELFVDTVMRVSSGEVLIDENRYHRVNQKMQARYSVSKYLKTKGKKTYVYQYPQESNNKLLFTLKKGVKYKPLQLRFTDQYTFIQIKIVSSKKTGWIGINTSSINSGPHKWTNGIYTSGWQNINDMNPLVKSLFFR